jgi:hypothetical protein
MISNDSKPISVCCQVEKIFSPKPIKLNNNNSEKVFFNFKPKISKRKSFKNHNTLNQKKEKKTFLDCCSYEEIENDFKTLELKNKIKNEITLNSTKTESNESSPQNHQKIIRPQNPFYKNFETENE